MTLWSWRVSRVRSQRKKNKKNPSSAKKLHGKSHYCLRIISIQDIWTKASITYCPGRKHRESRLRKKKKRKMYVCLEEDPPWKVCVLSVRTIHPIHFCRQPRPEFGVKFCLSNSRIFWLMKIKNILYMLGKSYKCLFGRKTVPLWRCEGGGGVVRGRGLTDR